MNYEDTCAVLESIANGFSDGSPEKFAITRAAEALAFTWQRDIKKQFAEFLEQFHEDPTEEQLHFLRSNGWIE